MISQPWQCTQLRNACTLRRNAGNDPCRAYRTLLRIRGMLARITRKWLACVRRPWQSTRRRVGRWRRTPDPTRCNAPSVWDRPLRGRLPRTAGMPRHIRCKLANRLLQQGWTSQFSTAQLIQKQNLGLLAIDSRRTAALNGVGARRR